MHILKFKKSILQNSAHNYHFEYGNAHYQVDKLEWYMMSNDTQKRLDELFSLRDLSTDIEVSELNCALFVFQDTKNVKKSFMYVANEFPYTPDDEMNELFCCIVKDIEDDIATYAVQALLENEEGMGQIAT